MRGLNAPPRRRRGAGGFTACGGARQICSSLSTEHGPAITPTRAAADVRLPARTTVGSGFTSRLATL